MKATYSDAQLKEVWSQFGSPSAVARHFGVSVRGLQERRRKLEAKEGIELACTNDARAIQPPAPDVASMLAELHELRAKKVSPNDPPPRDVEVDSLRKKLREAQADKSIQEWARQIIHSTDEKARNVRPAVWTQEPATGLHPAGIPTLLLSDLHWGEVVLASEVGGVNEYNMEIARRRLKRVVEKTCDLLRHHVVGDYPGIVVCLGGDMISGAIHDELEQTNDGTVMQQALDIFEHLQAAILMLVKEFGKVHLPCVTGNHGRSNRKWQAKRRASLSYEWLVYQFLQRAFKDDERITWDIPDGPDTDFALFDTTYRLTHGDTFKSGDSVIGPVGPITRGNIKRGRMAAAMHQPYQCLLLGHWHTLTWGSGFIVNSSLKGFDEFAMSLSITPEPPAQALWLTTEQHGRTIQLPVYAEE